LERTQQETQSANDLVQSVRQVVLPSNLILDAQHACKIAQ